MDYITEIMPLGDLNMMLADEAGKRLNLKPAEVQFVRKGIVAETKSTDDDERSSKELITVETKDRDGEILLTKGVVLEHYQSNPLVLFAHNYHAPPIGRNAWIKRDNKAKGLLAKTIYAATAFAEEIWQLVKGGFLPGRSMGFIPLEVHAPTEAEIKENPERKGAERIYDKWELLEYSVVPIPSNRQALVQAIGKSINLSPELMTQLGIEAEPLSELRIEQKPLPNEHSCRLRNPDDFQSDSMRRMEREHEGKKYSVIMGRMMGEDTMTDQAFRYNKDTWTAEQAGGHCKSHDGSFEAATPERSVQPVRIVVPVKRFVMPVAMAKKTDNSLDIRTRIIKMVKNEINRKRGRV